MSLKKSKTGLNRYEGTILILAVFIFDCITGNWLKIVGYDNPQNVEQWRFQMTMFLAAKSYFTFAPYILIGLFMLKRIDFDEFDIILWFLCILTCIKTTWDYYDNRNEMPTWLDWQTFSIAFLFILVIKLSWNRLQKIISRILRWS